MASTMDVENNSVNSDTSDVRGMANRRASYAAAAAAAERNSLAEEVEVRPTHIVQLHPIYRFDNGQSGK